MIVGKCGFVSSQAILDTKTAPQPWCSMVLHPRNSSCLASGCGEPQRTDQGKQRCHSRGHGNSTEGEEGEHRRHQGLVDGLDFCSPGNWRPQGETSLGYRNGSCKFNGRVNISGMVLFIKIRDNQTIALRCRKSSTMARTSRNNANL